MDNVTCIDPIEKCAKLAAENNELRCRLEQKEKEIIKAKQEREELRAKNQYLDMRVSELDQERHFLGAQLDIVRLIFGGRN